MKRVADTKTRSGEGRKHEKSKEWMHRNTGRPDALHQDLVVYLPNLGADGAVHGQKYELYTDAGGANERESGGLGGWLK